MTIHLMDNTSDEDSFFAVADFVANLLNDGQAKTALADTPGSTFVAACVAAVQAQRFNEYLLKMAPQLDIVFSKASDKESECVANVLVHSISRVAATPDQLPACVQALASAFTNKLDERAEERLGAVLNLYGALHEVPALQRQVLLTAIDYARKGPRLAGMLVPAVRGKSSDWITQWKLDDSQARELLIALASLVKLGADRASVKEYQRLVGQALQLAKQGDAAAATALRSLALQAMAEFVRSPTMLHADWSSSAAISALASDAAAQPLHRLFTATLAGDVRGAQSAATPAALEAAATSADAALSKVRLVALCALCSGTSAGGQQEVSFQAIQQALDVPAEQVEVWLVRAIGAKLLEGKIDQVRGVVSVSRSTHRTFGQSEWAGIGAQLAAWRDAIRSVQHTIAQHAASNAAAAGTAAVGSSAGAPAAAKPPAVRA